MTRNDNSFNRRTALKKGGVAISTLAVGLPMISGTAAADHIPSMIVDVPPSLSPEPNGNVTTAIYPGDDVGDIEEDLLDHEGFEGFKLGPHDEDEGEPTPDELEAHADAVRWRLVDNGVHGEVLGVFFDASTADEWFTPEHDAAKVSAVSDGPLVEDDDIIAWGWRSVTIPGTSRTSVSARS